MSEATLRQRLAAILAADAAGYSRLMSADERSTVEALDAARTVFRTQIESTQGRVIDMTGDSVLAVFELATRAVSAALQIQRDLDAASNKLPERQRMRFRIGVHLGEIFEKADGTVYGDGVNIAARLEGLAKPGGVAVSDTVHSAVRGKLRVDFDDLGEQTVKNIAAPVRAYHALPVSDTGLSHRTGDDAASSSESLGAGALELPTKPSIVVLAFENMSGDPEQDYFSDGVAEDIITDLSKISGIFVIARNSAFSYKGKQMNVRTVSRELGVRYVLEGSVRKSGARVRVTAQLVDGTTGGHVWAERYDRELTDIFAVQDELTREIVSALAAKLTEKERRLLGQRGTDNPLAHDFFLRGHDQLLRLTREANQQARSMLEQAIALDPKFSTAYSDLAINHVNAYINQWGKSDEQPLELAVQLAERAVALDEFNARAHFALGYAALWKKQHDIALSEGKKAIGSAPNSPDGYHLLASFEIYAGDPREAVASLRKAMRLDPHYKDILLHLLAQAHFQQGQFEEAIEALKRRLVRKPDSDISRVLLASAYGHLGNVDKSRAAWDEALRINPEYSLEHRRQILPYKGRAGFELMVDGLRKAGLVD